MVMHASDRECGVAAMFAAVRRVAAGVGPSQLRKITSAGFDAGGQLPGCETPTRLCLQRDCESDPAADMKA